MSRKRKLPAGKLGQPAQPAPHALENEMLALLLGGNDGPPERHVRRLRQRHPDLTAEAAADLVERCLQAKRSSFTFVAAAVARGDSSAHAAGRILEAYPWIDLRNVDALCAQAFVVAVR